MWKIEAVRPESFSQFFSSTSRGLVVKPPAAAPHNTPQEGTKFLSVTHGLAGAAVAAVVPAIAVPAPTAMAARTVNDFANLIRTFWFPPRMFRRQVRPGMH
ncbi:hypothetical protein ACFQFC_13155 [Amorphoplanes digitatis]|uniref:hypothetical protein n=1 Tax=Actinoplanes digitatis TaxID=1868 RepID=UPI003613DD72